MDSAIVGAVCAWLIAVTATPVVRAVAVRNNWLDHALRARKQHGRPVPRLGGVAIVASSYVGVIAVCVVSTRMRTAFAAHAMEVGALAVGGVAVAGIGLYDDLRGASARQKLVVQLAVAALLWTTGVRVDHLAAEPFMGSLELGWLSLPVTALWLVGVSNGFNIVDGLDGLAAGLAVVTGIGVTMLAAHSGDVVTVVLAMSIMGAVAGFLAFNAHPASVFMGDTGSLFLGLALGALVLRPYHGSAAGLPLVGVALLFGVPILDLVLACVCRALRGMPLFCGDRDHLHHRLVARGLGHWGAVLVLWFLAAALMAAGVPNALSPAAHPGLLLGAGLLVTTTIIGAGAAQLPDPAAWGRRRRNRLRMSEIRQLGERIERAFRLADLRHDLFSASIALDARSIRLRSAMRGHAARKEVAWFVLDESHPWLGALEVRWRDGKANVDRDKEIAVEELCRYVARALARIRSSGLAHTKVLGPDRAFPWPGSRQRVLRGGEFRDRSPSSA